METINIKLVIAHLLNEFRQSKDLKKVATDYPKNWVELPIAIYRTKSEAHFIDADNNELQTKWNVTIELYSDKGLTDVTERIIKRFGDVGIRLSKKDGNTADLKRNILDGQFIVDNTLKIIYEK